MFAVVVVGGLAVGAWLLARIPLLDRAGPPLVSERVSVVIPARDESANLPRLLASLRDSDPVPYEVIVVDDGSTDDTAAVAAAHGATVRRDGPLPAGWLGKPWACSVGAATATGSHLLFLDADAWLAPDAIARLLEAHRTGGGLVSVQPYHVTVRAYEELSAYCNVVSMMGTGAFTPVSGASAGAAFGPCLLASVEEYVRAGGHAAVRGEVLEDVALARRFRGAGSPVRCYGGGASIRFRMYPQGPAQLVEGWSKNLASGSTAAHPAAVAGATLWVSVHVLVALKATAGIVSWLAGRGPAPLAWLVAWLVTALQLRSMLRRVGSFRPWTALAFPVPLAAFVALFVRSVSLTFLRRQVRWRGRRIGTRAGAAAVDDDGGPR